eukprot:gene250-biopygen2248
MQQHLNDINDARTELITANMHMQQQINHVRDAVRALEYRWDAGAQDAPLAENKKRSAKSSCTKHEFARDGRVCYYQCDPLWNLNWLVDDGGLSLGILSHGVLDLKPDLGNVRVQSLHDHVHAISDQSAVQVVILVAERVLEAFAQHALHALPQLEDVIPEEMRSKLPTMPLRQAWMALELFRATLPNLSPSLSRLDSLAFPMYQMYREVNVMISYEEFEHPGKLTVSRSPHQAAMDDVMCSVFHGPNVVRIVADNMGFEYLSRAPQHRYPDEIEGMFYGLLDRIVLPMLVEEFMLLKAGTAEHPPPLVQIVMMYDTGSSLTYLTKEVLETLGYEPSYDILKRDEMFDVKLNGRAMQVGLCPKERCEHVCLLGQKFFRTHGLTVAINYKQQTVKVAKANE